jgi:hypothetical protein
MVISNCGPDGVLCGRRIESINGSKEQFAKERAVFTTIARAAQQQKVATEVYVQSRMAEQGISAEDYAKALADAAKTKWDVIKEVAWEVIKDLSGWNDIVDCFTKGDIWACGGLILNLVPASKAMKILEAGVDALKAVKAFDKAVTKARSLLSKVGILQKEAEAVATESLETAGASAGCSTKHSFVGSTRVLMADGSAKPISQVKIGDKVTATDPESGESTSREVVATIVHADEGDMTRLTLASESGTASGSVDATSWHPVWVEAEGEFVKIGELRPGQRLTSADGSKPVVTDVRHYFRVERVYNLTVEEAHTYHVLSSSGVSALVHNDSFVCQIGANGWPIPTKDNCFECAEKIKDKIGGDIYRASDSLGSGGLGPSKHDPHGQWKYHFVVVKDDIFYDGFTGPAGMPFTQYRDQWTYGEYLNFKPHSGG